MIEKIELIENILKIGTYEKMYRINYNGLRVYVSENPFNYYSGLTGALSACTFKGDPSERRLKDWRESMIDSYGAKKADEYVEFTADFGTLLHTSLVTIKNKGGLNWNEEADNATEYFISAYNKKELEPNTKIIKKMVYEYQKHAASLMQFVFERVDEIYAIETIAKNDYLKIATPIDLVCSCRQTPKGEFEKTCINLKTSSQITEHHLEQVSCEFAMWKHTYEELENAAILRTKDWRESKTPTYDYKYIQAKEALQISNEAFIRMEMCLNSKASYYPEPTSRYFEGETKVGEQPTIIIRSLKEEWETIDANKFIDAVIEGLK